MQNLHLQSDSECETPDYKLFSAGQIAAGTFFGSIIAGGLLLASNYSYLGDKKKALQTGVLSIFGFVLVLIVMLGLFDEMPEHPKRGLTHMLNFGIALGLWLLAKKLQGVEYVNHIERRGGRVSNWNVVAFVIVISILYFAAVVLFSTIS